MGIDGGVSLAAWPLFPCWGVIKKIEPPGWLTVQTGKSPASLRQIRSSKVLPLIYENDTFKDQAGDEYEVDWTRLFPSATEDLWEVGLSKLRPGPNEDATVTLNIRSAGLTHCIPIHFEDD